MVGQGVLQCLGQYTVAGLQRTIEMSMNYNAIELLNALSLTLVNCVWKAWHTSHPSSISKYRAKIFFYNFPHHDCIHIWVNRITYWSQGVASLPHKCQPPLPSDRQHPSYGDCLEVKGEYCQSCSVLGCVIQCSQSAAHLYEQFLQVQQIRFVTLGPLRRA